MANAMSSNPAAVVASSMPAITPLRGDEADYDALIRRCGDSRWVLLGAATHGTHEFYAARALITRRLLVERGFHAVAVEADWPDAYRVNRFVRLEGEDQHPVDALGSLKRFPQWLWRNRDVVELVTWLRSFNAARAPRERVGFYGLDLYSLHRSLEAVVRYLDKVDPKAAKRARARYACFERFGDDPQAYGLFTAIGTAKSCERGAVDTLIELREHAWRYLEKNGVVAEDEQFCAEQNARVARNAERYYREMLSSDARGWNLRERHMAETLAALDEHLEPRFGEPRVVVWAHNSHVGDARATAMGERGQLNLGQLAREEAHAGVVLVGFSSYEGTVAAAHDWGAPVHQRKLLPARKGTLEAHLHQLGLGDVYLDTARLDELTPLRGALPERAVGVIYRPETELASHYFDARVADQFDALFHFDRTRAVEPLERTAAWDKSAVPETYPTGI